VQPEARIEAAELYALISTLPRDFRDAVVAIDVIGLSYAYVPTTSAGTPRSQARSRKGCREHDSVRYRQGTTAATRFSP
jgi:hypothetical protein